MAMTQEEILTGLGEIIDEVAGVPADPATGWQTKPTLHDKEQRP